MIVKYIVMLQRMPKRGDVVLIFDTGGTGQYFIAAPPNSFPRPSRLFVKEDGEIKVLRHRDSYGEFPLEES